MLRVKGLDSLRLDELLSLSSLVTLYERYLVRDPEMRELPEAPQAFELRVAMGLVLNK